MKSFGSSARRVRAGGGAAATRAGWRPGWRAGWGGSIAETLACPPATGTTMRGGRAAPLPRIVVEALPTVVGYCDSSVPALMPEWSVRISTS